MPQKKAEPEHTPDTMYRSRRNNRKDGSSRRHVMRGSVYTRAAMSDIGRVLPVLALGALVVAGVRAMRKAG